MFTNIKCQCGHVISVNVLRWIENWLCGRKQRVVLSGQVSDCCDVLGAVTQGSVLRLALFALYMYISDSVSNEILSLDDDTKMYC